MANYIATITYSGTGQAVLVSTDPVFVGAEQVVVPASGGVTGDASVTLPSITSGGDAEREITASGDVTLPSITVSAAGIREVTGSATVTLPSITASASAVSGSDGLAFITLPSIEASATGAVERKSTASIEMPSITASASGARVVAGDASIQLPPITAELTQSPVAFADIMLPAMSVSASALNGASKILDFNQIGDNEVSGWADIDLPSITTSGSVSREIKSTGAITLPSITTSGSVSREITASGDVTLPSISASASGTVTVAGVSLTSAQDEGIATFTGSGFDDADAVTITITGGDYAGTYTTAHDATALTWGLIRTTSVCLVKIVETSGNTGVGQTLTYRPSLWVTPLENPEPVFNQQCNGVNIGDSTLSRVLTTGDCGTDFTIEETLDGVTVESAAVSIPASTTATDTQAIFRYVQSDVTASGTTFTSWQDSASGADGSYDIDTIPTGSTAPTVQNGRVEFNGVDQAATTTAGFTPPIEITEFGMNVFSWFIVADVPNNTTSNRYAAGWYRDTGTNQSFTLGAHASTDLDADTRARRFSDFYNANSRDLNNSITPGKHLIELRLTTSLLEYYIDGILEYSVATGSTGNLPDRSDMFYTIGARGNATSSAEWFTGNIYEMFATYNTADIAAFRSEIAARNGITL